MSKAKRGGKITMSHSTLTETAAEVANHAVRLNIVKKISVGEITHVHGGRRGLKFLPIVGGIKAVVRGSGGVQDLYLYTKSPLELERLLLEGFRK